MAGGTAVAYADGGSAAGSASDSNGSASGADNANSNARGTARGHSARKSGESPAGSNSARRTNSAPKLSASTRAADSGSDLPAAAAAVDTADAGSARSTDTDAATPSSATASAANVSAAKTSDIRTAHTKALAAIDSAAAAASTPSPAADPSFSMTSWVDGTAVTPGSSVALALEQISDAQDALNETWSSGNILAGLVSLAPQFFLSQAATSLNTWATATPAAQQAVADTMDIPVMHQLAQLQLLNALQAPSVAVNQLQIAALFIPLVGLFGASSAASQASQLVSSAQTNGRVYGVVPLTMKANTEPVVYISLNGGPKVPVLVDTGSSGLVISPTAVGNNFGTPSGQGTSGYSGGLSYDYNTYYTTVDFGNGIVSAPTAVNVVSPEDAAAFDNYFRPAQVVGVLGIGANAAGPGPSVPNAALPGELGNGVLIYQDLGVMVFGPNPLPAWATIPGTPNANIQIQVGNGNKTPAYAIIDSGGVYGTMPNYLIGNSGNIPSGTRISVYTNDGQTLLYTYTTKGVNSPTVVGDTLHNTGNEPFAQFPVYIDYDPDNGIGSTVFSQF
jgi:hypothetical protein